MGQTEDVEDGREVTSEAADGTFSKIYRIYFLDPYGEANTLEGGWTNLLLVILGISHLVRDNQILAKASPDWRKAFSDIFCPLFL